jgi:hypothetical protein
MTVFLFLAFILVPCIGLVCSIGLGEAAIKYIVSDKTKDSGEAGGFWADALWAAQGKEIGFEQPILQNKFFSVPRYVGPVTYVRACLYIAIALVTATSALYLIQEASAQLIQAGHYQVP